MLGRARALSAPRQVFHLGPHGAHRALASARARAPHGARALRLAPHLALHRLPGAALRAARRRGVSRSWTVCASARAGSWAPSSSCVRVARGLDGGRVGRAHCGRSVLERQRPAGPYRSQRAAAAAAQRSSRRQRRQQQQQARAASSRAGGAGGQLRVERAAREGGSSGGGSAAAAAAAGSRAAAVGAPRPRRRSAVVHVRVDSRARRCSRRPARRLPRGRAATCAPPRRLAMWASTPDCGRARQRLVASARRPARREEDARGTCGRAVRNAAARDFGWFELGGGARGLRVLALRHVTPPPPPSTHRSSPLANPRSRSGPEARLAAGAERQ